MKPACDRLWEVDALREGRLSSADAVAHERHAAVCPHCRERYAADEHLVELGRALEVPEPDPLRTRRLRASILRLAARSPAPRPTWLVPALLAGGVGFALAAGLVLRHRPPPAESVVSVAPPPIAPDAGDGFAASVTAMPGARWSRTRDGTLELVRVDDGTVALHVRKQQPTERFLVDLPDGRVEVRGTVFEVTVRDGMTTSIHVDEGVVVFQRAEHRDVTLRALDTWQPEQIAPRRAASSTASSPPVNGASGASGALGASETTSEYQLAVAAYHAHDYAGAEQKLSAFVSAHPTAPEVEDASFLQASALAHGGRSADASLAAERFLQRFPASFHARDAAILGARGARDRGDCSHARALLAPYTSAPGAVPGASGAGATEIATVLASCAAE